MGMRWGMVAVAAAVAACTPPRVERVEKPVATRARAPGARPATAPSSVALLAVPRPEIDIAQWIPDPHDELRWPLGLMDHPVLQPHFDVASALAEPGVGWVDLCRLGAQNRHASSDRHELLQYLRGWCRVADHDMDGALSQLAPLMASVTPGFAMAVRIDLANVLVDYGSADDAERRIAKHHIVDVPLLDVLAATFVEVGRLEDANQINDRTLATDHGSAAMRCQRLARRLLLGPARDYAALVEQLDALALGNDPTCLRLDHLLACWTEPQAGCAAYFTDAYMDIGIALLIANYAAWPERAQPQERWSTLADAFISVRGVDGADVLAVTALEAALRTTGCVATTSRAEIRRRAEVIRRDPSRDPTLDPRLDALINHAAEHCRTR